MYTRTFDRILVNEEPEIAEVVYKRSLDDGIKFYFGFKAVAFSSPNTVVLENKEQVTLNFKASCRNRLGTIMGLN